MKKTAWFGPKRKPDLIGVYETKDEYGVMGFQHWNGKFWGYYAAYSVEVAQQGADGESSWQLNKWRGLAHNPST